MAKAKKKPVEIEYFTYEELTKKLFYGLQQCFVSNISVETFPITNLEEIIGLYKQDTGLRLGEDGKTLYVLTLEGHHVMTDKDVLIKGVDGELYPCKIDIFERTYDVISK